MGHYCMYIHTYTALMYEHIPSHCLDVKLDKYKALPARKCEFKYRIGNELI